MEQVKQMPAPQLKCLVVGQRAKSPERGRSAWRAVFTDVLRSVWARKVGGRECSQMKGFHRQISNTLNPELGYPVSFTYEDTVKIWEVSMFCL